MKLTGLLLVLIVGGGPAAAEDWYWRPDRLAPYGAGNGTTYANAWRRAGEVRWSAMRPGDVLYLCGMHNGGGDDRQITVGAAGITVSGACPGDPGTLWSTGQKLTNWKHRGGGIYTTVYSGSPSLALNALQKPLRELTSPPTSSSPCDSWFKGDLFYYKPCGKPVAMHPNGPPPAVLVQMHDVTVTDLTVLNAARLVEVNNGRRVTLRRLHLYYGARQGIQITGTTSGGKVLESEIHDVGNGIVGTTTGRGYHNNWLIGWNYVHDVAGGPDGDSHCIGWQNGNNNRIRNNRLENCAGPALAIYWWGEYGELRDNQWSYNQIDSPANTGISVSGNNCPPVPTDAGGNVAIGNQVHGGPRAFYVKVAPYSLSVLDNSVSDAGVGLKWKYISGGNTAGAPPPFIETGNTWDATIPYEPPPASWPCS